MFRRLDDDVLVAGQIRCEDVATASSAGVVMIVNNRPDGEEPGQPLSSEIEAAARSAGLDFRYIPVASGFSANQVAAMSEALDAAEGPVLAFCRSGTRSAFLWGLARSRQGVAPDQIVAAAGAAGYDLRSILPLL